MKVVLDTNTVLQMFGARSPFARIKDALLSGQVTVAISIGIWLEYEEVVVRYAGVGVWTRVARIFALAEQLRGNVLHVEPSFSFRLIVADADDDKFADCAIAAGADFVSPKTGTSTCSRRAGTSHNRFHRRSSSAAFCREAFHPHCQVADDSAVARGTRFRRLLRLSRWTRGGASGKVGGIVNNAKFIIQVSKGLIRQQRARRLMMFYSVLVALVMLFAGVSFLEGLLREHPFVLLGYWAACAWLTMLAVLLALYDMAKVRAEELRVRRGLEQHYFEKKKDDENPS